MKKLWNIVNKMKIKRSNKVKSFLLLSMLINVCLAIVLGFVFKKIFLIETKWLLCFIAYLVVFIGLFGSIFYLFNHEFI